MKKFFLCVTLFITNQKLQSQSVFLKDLGINKKFDSPIENPIKVKKYRGLKYCERKSKLFFDTLTYESKLNNRESAAILVLINPLGQKVSFRIWRVDIDAGANEKAKIVSIRGQGISDPYAQLSGDFGPGGLHIQVRSVNGDYFIEPYYPKSAKKYISYFRSDLDESIRPPDTVDEPNFPVRQPPIKN